MFIHSQLNNLCKGSANVKKFLVRNEAHRTLVHFVQLILATGNQVLSGSSFRPGASVIPDVFGAIFTNRGVHFFKANVMSNFSHKTATFSF
jgi:hypothetical protein